MKCQYKLHGETNHELVSDIDVEKNCFFKCKIKSSYDTF